MLRLAAKSRSFDQPQHQHVMVFLEPTSFSSPRAPRTKCTRLCREVLVNFYDVHTPRERVCLELVEELHASEGHQVAHYFVSYVRSYARHVCALKQGVCTALKLERSRAKKKRSRLVLATCGGIAIAGMCLVYLTLGSLWSLLNALERPGEQCHPHQESPSRAHATYAPPPKAVAC